MSPELSEALNTLIGQLKSGEVTIPDTTAVLEHIVEKFSAPAATDTPDGIAPLADEAPITETAAPETTTEPAEGTDATTPDADSKSDKAA